MNRTQVTSARFIVTGEAITRIARERWREGSYAGALNLLECCIGITMAQCLAILAGRARLEGQNDDVNLVEDDWTPPDEYPTFADVAGVPGVAASDDGGGFGVSATSAGGGVNHHSSAGTPGDNLNRHWRCQILTKLRPHVEGGCQPRLVPRQFNSLPDCTSLQWLQ